MTSSSVARAVVAGAAGGAAATAAGAALLLRRYLQRELSPPDFFHSPGEDLSEEDVAILSELQPLLSDYWPHPILEFSGYVSLGLAGLLAILPVAAGGELETLELEDGGTVVLHWSEPPSRPVERLALILPGLNNDSRTGFVQGTVQRLRQQGFASVVLNYRGIGGQQLLTPRMGCADSWRDVPEVLAHARSRMPGAKLFAVGFSMGAGILLRYLGSEGARCPLAGAVAVSAPVDFLAVGRSLEGNIKKRGVNFGMTQGVKLLMLASLRRSAFAGGLDMKKVWLATRIRQIEEAVICPMHGYKDADEYYALNSPRPFLADISVPTLVVNSKDDPVVSVQTMPMDELQANPRIYTALTRRGGHIGWGSGGRSGGSWADCAAARFLDGCAARAEGHPRSLRTGGLAARSRL